MEQAVEIENFELAIKLRDLKFMLLKLREKTKDYIYNASASSTTNGLSIFHLQNLLHHLICKHPYDTKEAHHRIP